MTSSNFDYWWNESVRLCTISIIPTSWREDRRIGAREVIIVTAPQGVAATSSTRESRSVSLLPVLIPCGWVVGKKNDVLGGGAKSIHHGLRTAATRADPAQGSSLHPPSHSTELPIEH